MNTKALRQKILDLAIHGKLVPQDPNDEPASVLLERIRAEKERLIKEGKIKRPKKTKTTSDKPHYPYELPEGWVWTTLGEICCIKGGKRIPRGMTFAKGKTAHVYIRVTDMKDNTIKLSDLKYIDDSVYEHIKNYTINDSDLYLTIAGTIGSVGIVPNEVDGMNLTENAAKLTQIGCIKEYLLYALLSTIAQEHFISRFHQVAQPKLSIETASKTPIAMPPIGEQNRIVIEIKRYLAAIKIIEEGQTDLETTISQAKSKILDLAIHGKLVPQDPNDEPAAEMLKHINPKAEITCDNGHYQKLPEGWTVCCLENVAKVLDNLRKPINSNERNSRIANKHENELFPYYGATGQVGFIDDYLVDGTFLLLGEDGAPFLDKYAIKSYPIKGKCWVNNHAHILEPQCDFDYLMYYLNHVDYKDYVNGSTRLKLTQSDMRSIIILLPPLT